MQTGMDQLIESLCEQGEYMGLSVFVSKEGKEVYQKTAGYANWEKKIPIQKDTIFHLYSMSKPVTAVAVMKLWDDGELDLQEPLVKYLPQFSGQKVRQDGILAKREQEITIQDLLNMTSGIPYPDPAAPEMSRLFEKAMAAADQQNALSTMELINVMAETPLSFQPGSKWDYGASADVLGAVIEAVTGMRFGEYLQKEFFTPLGMEDTGFFVPPAKQERLAVIYSMKPGEKVVPYQGRNLAIMDYTREPAFESGGAGLFSSIKDYHIFMSMLLQEGEYGGKRYLHPKTVEFLRTGQLNSRQKEFFDWPALKGYTYGNFMRILENPAQQGVVCGKGEFGWDGWSGCYMAIHPEERVNLLIMTAQIDRENHCNRRKIRNYLYRYVL